MIDTIDQVYNQITAGPSPRIKRLEAEARVRGKNQPPYTFVADLAKAYYELEGIPEHERQARAFAIAIEQMPVYLLPDERIAGVVYHLGERVETEDPFRWHEAADKITAEALPENAELVELNVYTDGAARGHITWRWDFILQKGTEGLLKEYRLALENPKDEKAAEFYRCVIYLLEAFQRWCDKHTAAIKDALDNCEPRDRARLQELFEICSRVPRYPARNFREALQSFWFQHIAVMSEVPWGGNGPGRMDYFLWPYLERDIAEGVMTLQDARELIDELFIRLDEGLMDADGWVEAVVVGGSDLNGSPSINPLSYIIVESIMGLNVLHPSVYMRMPENCPDEFLALAAHYLTTGRNRAQILNDPAIIKAMETFGMSKEDAAMYTCGGCMEITPQGMNSDLLFAGFQNIPKTVELVITGGECLLTGRKLKSVDLPPLTHYKTFEDFYKAFENELARELNVFFRRLDVYSETSAEIRPCYLQSSMILDCLEQGRSMHDGGARYHDYGSSPMGMPNAADAIFAVKKAVYDDHICTAEELLAALRANFEGYEELRLKLRSIPKYGQQNPEADAMAARVMGSVCRIYESYRTRWGGRAKPVVLTFVWAPMLGSQLGATADGNFAGTPIAQSLTPQSSSMTEGITAAIGSYTSMPLNLVAGGGSSMWDIDPQWAKPEVVESLLRTFLKLGGHIWQGNTTDVEELIKAREKPEDYQSLMVRVGGFSARFVALDDELQKEIITRRRHAG